jgi:regulation of enolase protein 1 (concanavalin A-like superfamily)
MEWLNEPASWQRTGDVLTVSVDPGTDFWRETGYGYIRDSGHVYGEVLAGDLDVSVRLRCTLGVQYDQAGVMLRADERTWLKTGVEFFEGRARLSTVLTLGRSSWMVTDLPEGTDDIVLRVSRRGDAVEVRYVIEDGPAELAALVFLPPGREVLAGVMAAAPEGPGFRVTFHDLRITERDWSGEAGDGAAWTDDQPGWAGDEAPAWTAEDGGPAWRVPGQAGEAAPDWPAAPAETEPPAWPVPAAGEEDLEWPGPAAEADEPGWLAAVAGEDDPDWPAALRAEDGEPDWAAPPVALAAAPEPAALDALDEPAAEDSARPEDARAEPAEVKSAAAEPAEVKPAAADSAGAKPAAADSAGAKPAGAKPAGAESAEATLADPGAAGAGLDRPEPARAGTAEPEPLTDEPDGPEPAGPDDGGHEPWSPAPLTDHRGWTRPAGGGVTDVDPAADWERLAAGAQAGPQAAPWSAQIDAEVANEWPGPPLRTAVRNGLLAGVTQAASVPGDQSADDAQTDPGLPRPRIADAAEAAVAADPGLPEASDTGPDAPQSSDPDQGKPQPSARESRRARSKRAAADLPAEPDAADEWISLLTADPVDE